MGVGGIPGPAGRLTRSYVSGLCAAALGLCAAGWLALAPVAFGYRSAVPHAPLHRAELAGWSSAAGLALVSLATLAAWIAAWRRKLRADGILAQTSRRQAWREARARRRAQDRAQDEVPAADGAGLADGPPDPARVLSELRALLVPLLAEPETAQPEPAQPEAIHAEAAQPADMQAVAALSTAVPQPRPGGLAATESMLAGAELLMVTWGEEEAW